LFASIPIPIPIPTSTSTSSAISTFTSLLPPSSSSSVQPASLCKFKQRRRQFPRLIYFPYGFCHFCLHFPFRIRWGVPSIPSRRLVLDWIVVRQGKHLLKTRADFKVLIKNSKVNDLYVVCGLGIIYIYIYIQLYIYIEARVCKCANYIVKCWLYAFRALITAQNDMLIEMAHVWTASYESRYVYI